MLNRTLAIVILLAGIAGCDDMPDSELSSMFPGTLPKDKPAKKEAPVVAPMANGIAASTRPAPGAQPASTQKSPTLDSDPTKPAPSATDASSQPARGDQVVSSSALQINGQYLTADEVLRSCGEALKAVPKNLSAEATFARCREIIADETYRTMSEMLVMQEAKNRINDEAQKTITKEMDHELNIMIAELAGGSQKKLEQVLISQGTTLRTVLDNQRRRLTVRIYLHEKFSPQVKVNRQTLWDYYKANAEEFSTPLQVQMQIIAAPVKAYLANPRGRPSEAEIAAAKKLAREAIDSAAADLKDGKDFGDVAAARSKDSKAADRGVWPMMPAGSFAETKVEKAAFAMSEGGVSDVIETENGFYIVKAFKVQGGKVESFEDAQMKVEEKLRIQQENNLTREYFKKIVSESTLSSSASDEYGRFVAKTAQKAAEKLLER